MKFRVKNWQRFQHYRDRNPPWIKLHFSLLSSSDWVMLDDASRVLAVSCMLLASKNDGQIDGSEAGLAYLKRVAYLNTDPELKPLIVCGFLEHASDSKQMLAVARPETETETETETEVLTEKLSEKQAEGQKQKLALSRLAWLPPWIPKEPWQAWLEMRKKKHVPNTDRAMRIAVSKLATLRAAGEETEAVIDQSTVSGWTKFYPVAKPRGSVSKQSALEEHNTEVARRFVERGKTDAK